jgi:hypothetical protein
MEIEDKAYIGKRGRISRGYSSHRIKIDRKLEF